MFYDDDDDDDYPCSRAVDAYHVQWCSVPYRRAVFLRVVWTGAVNTAREHG